MTLADPGVQDLQAGTPVFLAMRALDSAPGHKLAYSVTGLPPGLRIARATGHISGTLTGAAGTSTVTVTAADAAGAEGSVRFSMVVVKSLTTGYHAVPGPVHAGLAGVCMDGNRRDHERHQDRSGRATAGPRRTGRSSPTATPAGQAR